MEHLASIIKVLFEKRFIPTLIGVIVGIISYAITSETNALLEKLGKNLFIALFICIGIIASTMVQFIFSKIIEIVHICKERININEKNLAKERQNIHELWDTVDKLSKEERKLLTKLLSNGNKPIEEFISYNRRFNDIRDNSLWMKSMDVVDSEGICKKKYVLNEDIYNMLLYSKQNYGRISNFPDDLEKETSK